VDSTVLASQLDPEDWRVVVRDGCAAATAQAHDTCMDLVFPRMAWVASVDDVINAIRG
jgi:hypothetical protein